MSAAIMPGRRTAWTAEGAGLEMWPFGPKLPIDRDELDFQLATFKWLIRQFGPVEGRPLILPNPDFFPLTIAGVQGAVSELFERVRGYAGMTDWPCRLAPPDSQKSIRPI